jgi:hypothetical protein
MLVFASNTFDKASGLHISALLQHKQHKPWQREFSRLAASLAFLVLDSHRDL